MANSAAVGDSAGWHTAVATKKQTQCCPNVHSEMSAKQNDKSKWRRRKCTKSPVVDNDCVSLAWLLNFRLDEIVKVKVPDDDFVPEPKIEVTDTPPAVRKPPFTYPELIEKALREKGELTVSAIYQWIS